MTRGTLILCLVGYAVLAVLLSWCWWRLMEETKAGPDVRAAEDNEQAEWLRDLAGRR